MGGRPDQIRQAANLALLGRALAALPLAGAKVNVDHVQCATEIVKLSAILKDALNVENDPSPAKDDDADNDVVTPSYLLLKTKKTLNTHTMTRCLTRLKKLKIGAGFLRTSMMPMVDAGVLRLTEGTSQALPSSFDKVGSFY
jgi:hypothetical protein